MIHKQIALLFIRMIIYSLTIAGVCVYMIRSQYTTLVFTELNQTLITLKIHFSNQLLGFKVISQNY